MSSEPYADTYQLLNEVFGCRMEIFFSSSLRAALVHLFDAERDVHQEKADLIRL